MAHVESLKQCRDRQLAAAVNTDMHNILGIKFEVQPGAAIRDNAGGEQQFTAGMGLTLVVVEEDTRATMHLGNDNPFGTVNDESAFIGHQRHIAHIDALFLDIENRFCLGIRIHFEHDQAQGCLQRGCIRHAALLTLLFVIFRWFKFVRNEFQARCIGEILDRKN